MAGILENIIIMVLTIVVLIGVGYLVLVLLNWGLKLKGAMREDDGLVELWAQAKKEEKFSADTTEPTDDHQQ